MKLLLLFVPSIPVVLQFIINRSNLIQYVLYFTTILILTTSKVKFLKPHYCASIINNRRITAATVKANKRLLWANNISYMQAYRTIQALLDEIDGSKSECFAKFPAYIEQYIAVNLLYYTDLKLLLQGNFEAIFFCPAGYRRACVQIRPLLAIDGTHTRSKYRIQLLIAVGIDANNNGVLVAWALVPMEDEYWWT
jgi:hypothetical protein